MIQHRCTANDGGLAIVYTGKDWRLNGVQDWAIHHCPYCGLKLEPPDVKIEVSRKELDTWHAQLFRARRLVQGFGNQDLMRATGDMASVIQQIEAALLND